MSLLLFFGLVLFCHSSSFIWGAATAAYQIEGGVSSRGVNNWDVYSHIPGKIWHNQTGDVADDSYTRYREDVSLLSELGVSHYRFSISWSRIFPTLSSSLADSPDPVGVAYYNSLINLLLASGIEPTVTMFHWDLPIYLDWLKQDELVTHFGIYARACYRLFGDRVSMWITLNEPLSFTTGGFNDGNAAPGRCTDRSRCTAGNSATEPYIVAKTAIVAHGVAYRIYEKEFKSEQKGRVGWTLNLDDSIPWRGDEVSEDVEAAERSNEFKLGWFADPVFFGDYPQSMKDNVKDRLPAFNDTERAIIVNSLDFLGLNHYTTVFAYPSSPVPPGKETWETDMMAIMTPYAPNGSLIGPQADSTWLHVYPPGFRHALNWVSKRYHNPLIYVTENGIDCPGEGEMPVSQVVHDKCRISFIETYLEQLELAKTVDGVNVQGYFAWSLLDNYEWANGYRCRFGLTYVDREHNLERIKKDSFGWFKDHIATSNL